MLQGIDAHPLTEQNIFEWIAKIKGQKDTVWEGTLSVNCKKSFFCMQTYF